MADKRKETSKKRIFFLGVFVGMLALWFPLESEFSPVRFSKKTFSDTQNIFANHLPITSPIIKREGYTLAYDARCRNAHWVYHKLTSSDLEAQTKRSECQFREDPLFPKHLRASKTDYESSGFDRGHLFPAADSTNQKSMEESFFLSNIAPQTPAFNRGYWKRVENHIRDLTKKYDTVHVFTGPLYMKTKEKGKSYVKYQVIGEHDVAVPTHFFSLIFVETSTQKMQAKAYILPNEFITPKTPLKKYAASLEEIEKASGILFLQILNDYETTKSP